MSETNSDDALADLFRDMFALIESRKLGMTSEEHNNALAFVAMLTAHCAEATRYCHRMNFTDSGARHFMRGLLSALVERTRQDMGIESAGALH
jgi:uncharacterized protein (DUF924 family)